MYIIRDNYARYWSRPMRTRLPMSMVLYERICHMTLGSKVQRRPPRPPLAQPLDPLTLESCIHGEYSRETQGIRSISAHN